VLLTNQKVEIRQVQNYLATAKKREYDPAVSKDLKDVQLTGGERTVRPKKSD
jgi:hypothetical protein